MAKQKIDEVKLNRLLKDGKSQREVAQALGVTEGAVSRARKRLNISVVKSVSLESAHKVVEHNLNTVEQLQKINCYANELLDLLMRWNRGDKESLQILESQVRKVRVRGSEKEIAEYRFKDPRELAIRIMGEIRSQLALQLDIFKCLYDVEAVADFQREVLEIIGEIDKDVRDRIIQRLKESRAVRSAIDIR